MSQTRKKDALLVIARVATIAVRAALVLAIVGLGAAGLASLVAPGLLGEHVTVEVAPASLAQVKGATGMVLAITLVSFGLMYDFVARLARIIDTVGEGDPFTRENAARLKRMGWLAIAVQLLTIPVSLLSTWLESRVDEGSLQIDTDFSLTGLGLALVLFILARVFAKGAEMREDLEGTV